MSDELTATLTLRERARLAALDDRAAIIGELTDAWFELMAELLDEHDPPRPVAVDKQDEVRAEVDGIVFRCRLITASGRREPVLEVRKRTPSESWPRVRGLAELATTLGL